MMTKNQLRKIFPLLKVLNRLKPDDLTVILEFLNTRGCEAVCDCVKNAIHNQHISTKNKKKLKKRLVKDKQIYYRLIKGRKASKQKQKKLVQVGGSAVGLIISAVLPVLAQYLFKKIVE